MCHLPLLCALHVPYGFTGQGNQVKKLLIGMGSQFGLPEATEQLSP